MDLETAQTSTSVVKCCNCGCSCSLMNRSLSGTWLRSVKRKSDDFEENHKKFTIPGLNIQQVARVEVENECVALREMVSSQQQSIDDLLMELEEERNASSSAANEAMSMILRLQREKAETQMEARQFKRFAEEKMAHDQHELVVLEDLLYKREQAIQSLSCEVRAYKLRMMSYGLTEAEADGEKGGISRNSSAISIDPQLELPTYDYPPLKCNPAYPEIDSDVADIEKYAFGETPGSRESLKDLEYRINQLERSPRHNQLDGESPGTKNVLEKATVGNSPRQIRHFRRVSTDSTGSFNATVKEMAPTCPADSPRLGSSFRKTQYFQTEDYSNLKKVDSASEIGDDMNDRVYTIDSVHKGVTYNGVMGAKTSMGIFDDYTMTPRESLEDPDIQKLYMRLQALEADRESMRQALISMRTDKAQLVLLKEIAQHLCNEMTPGKDIPVKKQSLVRSISFVSVFKWVVSFVFWKRRAQRSKYMFGLSSDNAGLLMLLDKAPRAGQWRCVRST